MRESVKVKDRSWRSKVYPSCFVGKYAVKWLSKSFSMTTEESVKIGRELQKAGFLVNTKKKKKQIFSFLN